MSTPANFVSSQWPAVQTAISELELSSYRKGILDAASLCRELAKKQQGVALTEKVMARAAYFKAADALLEIAQNLVQLPP